MLAYINRRTNAYIYICEYLHTGKHMHIVTTRCGLVQVIVLGVRFFFFCIIRALWFLNMTYLQLLFDNFFETEIKCEFLYRTYICTNII